MKPPLATPQYHKANATVAIIIPDSRANVTALLPRATHITYRLYVCIYQQISRNATPASPSRTPITAASTGHSNSSTGGISSSPSKPANSGRSGSSSSSSRSSSSHSKKGRGKSIDEEGLGGEGEIAASDLYGLEHLVRMLAALPSMMGPVRLLFWTHYRFAPALSPAQLGLTFVLVLRCYIARDF